MRRIKIIKQTEEYFEGRLNGLKISFRKDLKQMQCELCHENKTSFKFNGYCHHIGDFYRIIYGIKEFNEVYEPYIESLRLKNIIKRSKMFSIASGDEK